MGMSSGKTTYLAFGGTVSRKLTHREQELVSTKAPCESNHTSAEEGQTYFAASAHLEALYGNGSIVVPIMANMHFNPQRTLKVKEEEEVMIGGGFQKKEAIAFR